MNVSAYMTGYQLKETGMEKTAVHVVEDGSRHFALGQNFSLDFMNKWYDSLGKLSMDEYRKKCQREQKRK